MTIDPATWRAVSLEMTKPSGGRLWIELLRPDTWFEEHDAVVGATVFVDLAEMGASGEALVTNIQPCPPLESGSGTTVTGTFRHETDGRGLLALWLEDEENPTGVTDNHPYWSVDRRAFVDAGDLTPGELVNTEFGERRVGRIAAFHGYQGLLYNLETLEHVYRAGTSGTLVHNSCDGVAPNTGRLTQRADEVHSVLDDPIAMKQRTTAVLETSGGDEWHLNHSNPFSGKLIWT